MPTKIDWCTESINPLGWGCYGTDTAENPKICVGCYAHAQSKRNLRDCELCNKFIPHTHFEQLDKLAKWKMPRTVFVQSMGDLFGEWVSDDTINMVFAACRNSPQHRYLFLTKSHKRYMKEHIAYEAWDIGYGHRQPNWWFGISASDKTTLDERSKGLSYGMNTFLSLEPLQADVGLSLVRSIRDCNVKWVIVGAMTGKEAKNHRHADLAGWVWNIVEDCKNANIPVFLKDNLINPMGEKYVKENQQFPWGGVKHEH